MRRIGDPARPGRADYRKKMLQKVIKPEEVVKDLMEKSSKTIHDMWR